MEPTKEPAKAEEGEEKKVVEKPTIVPEKTQVIVEGEPIIEPAKAKEENQTNEPQNEGKLQPTNPVGPNTPASQ